MGFEVKEFTNLGMDKDSVISKTEHTFAYHNHNIRLSSTEDSTVLSVTNERGPQKMECNILKYLKGNELSFSFKKGKVTVRTEYPTQSDLYIFYYINGIESLKFFPKGSSKLSWEVEEYEEDDTLTNAYISRTQDSSDIEHYINDTYFTYYTEFADEPEITGSPVELEGLYVGHCEAGEYFVLFTSKETEDYIYRFKIDNNRINGLLLYSGKLGLDPNNNKFETLYYYESEDIQKVYWVDGVNQPRVINIVGEPNYARLHTQFDFIPTFNSIPKIRVQKEYEGLGVFPCGTIQYFVSFYNKYGAETGILAQSAMQYLSFEDRGAKADETVSCSFNITISNLDNSFDYARVYSAKRSSKNGPVELQIVADVSIIGNSVKVTDTNVNQETLDPNMIYFLGGEEYTAGTIACKDNTLFMGDIEYTNIPIDTNVKNEIGGLINVVDGFNDASCIHFDYKCFTGGSLEGEYGYSLQTNYSSRMFKTFKRGEIYRFAIQFLNKNGSWTNPMWIGDKLCDLAPTFDLDENQIVVPDAKFNLPSDMSEFISQYYSKYRILMAETNYTDRKILAQGVVCPTMFNYEERYNNKPFSIASWIMRPRNGNASWMHFSDTKEQTDSDAEIQSLTKSRPPIVENNNNDGAIIICMGISKYKKIEVLVYSVEYKENYNGDISTISSGAKLLTGGSEDYGNWKNCYTFLGTFFTKIGVDISSYIGYNEFYGYTSGVGSGGDPTWIDKSYDGALGVNGNVSNRHFYIPRYSSDVDTTVLEDVSDKKNNFYIDNSIVTFHSPELDEVHDLVDGSNLSFRIVGVVPITSSYSNATLITDTIGVSPYSRVNINPISYTSFESKNPKALITGNFYTDSGWLLSTSVIPSSTLENYIIYMWHKEGAISGQNSSTVANTNNEPFSMVHAKLNNKTFATQRFSYATNYIDYWNMPTSSVSIFNSDELSIKQIKNLTGNILYYQGNYDKVISGRTFYVCNENNTSIPSNINNALMKSSDPVRIGYKSTTHAVLSLCDENGVFHILPNMKGEDEYHLSNFYKDIDKNTDEKTFKYPWNNISIRNNIKCLGLFKCPDNVDNDSVKELLDPIVAKIDKKTLISDIKSIGVEVIALLVTNVSGVPFRYKCSISLGIKTITNDDKTKTETIAYHIEKRPATTFGFIKTNYYNIKMPHFTTDNKISGEENKVLIKKLLNISNYSIEWGAEYSYRDGTIKADSPKYPYLYMCELYRNLPYNSLYGGFDENAIEKIKWIPISDTTDIYSGTSKMEGDTYYQRWDCLKTYPFTEESTNKVVDITSFMVESHINLDGRCDVNRGNENLLHCRPTNFNLMNSAYTQDDNLFKYNVLDKKYDLNKFSNQIMWSMVKSPTEDIDIWTKISPTSSLYLDGNYGKVTKISLFNSSLVAFQDKAISTINYNERTQLSTEAGVPVEIQNSNRVNGYSYVSTNHGCTNKNSIVSAKTGVYFIDSFSKSFNMFGKGGIEDVSTRGMMTWFRNNSELEYIKVLYDKMTHDVYLVSPYNCLAYNEDLKRFTSFYSYEGIESLINKDGKSYVFYDNDFYKLFNGNFEDGLGSKKLEYSIEFRVNPEPYTDKVFTNIEYLADILNIDDNINSPHVEDYEDVPFDRLDVWNSYQEGSTTLSRKLVGPLAKKFRTWRVQIPRDSKSKFKNDRIRSPWAHIKLSNSNPNKKMVFHNLIVKYYK